MPSLDIMLDLSLETCRYHYEGAMQTVIATSVDGRRVSFPATALRRIVTPDGAHGVFRLTFSEEGKFMSMVAVRRWEGSDT
ncbi:DUF2835 domain-containing protein [Chromohalobacter canadensis]|jgi:hypothetical protein|uniref:DUF2835 domain-containing protein n=1 Tax=Chromohalobacter canadensis TaxID=141389 RepID=UPI0021C1E6AA|nr:DUF2835 domain-containing protein [Chromohalobacter canadensis]MCT8469809.1 DUF2835 domain-containing protein [Chromohalobacter canadensis]MCT8472356.1 DUF2835 domain-containing protein [Chromohalobacter canadensis]MCT8499531.1 DUF2835 domain-containing protein [Chromohalobacter canadensis]